MTIDYPRMTRSDVRDFVDTVVRPGATADTVEAFFVRNEFAPVSPEEKRIVELVRSMVLACGVGTDVRTEPIEAEYSGEVHTLLDTWPDEAIGDERFWTYLSARFFWEFVKIRQASAWSAAVGEPSNLSLPDSEKQKLERYFVGRDHYQLPLRMYLRGQAIRDGRDYSLALVEGTDFWRSQILGVRTSAYPPLARSVVTAQKMVGLNVKEQRPPGTQVNRLRANIEFARLDEAECDALVKPIWVTPPAVPAKKSSTAKKKPT